DVEAFIGMVDDVAANKGVMVAANSFTGTAKKRAADAGISLLTLVDAGSEEWRKYAAIPVVAVQTRMRSFNFDFSWTGPVVIKRDVDPTKIVLYRKDGTMIGTTGKLLAQRWRDGRIPYEAGFHQAIALAEEETWIETDGTRYRVNVIANVNVEVVRFFKMLR